MKRAELTNRERILAALHFQEVDRLPWSPLIDDYFIRSLPDQGMSMEIIEAMRYIGNDIMERHVGMPLAQYKNVTIRTEQIGDRARVYYETPVGTIYEETLMQGVSWFVSHHLVNTVEEAKIYQYVVEHMDYQSRIEEFIIRDKFIGDDGIATTSGRTSPIQELLQKTSTVENTVYLMYDYPDELDELLNAMHQRNLGLYKKLAQYPVKVVFDYEDTSSTVMSPAMYQKYSFPMIEDYGRIMHESGKLFITHMCGKLSVFADLIGQGTQDGIDSLCPPTTGDFYAWDARKCWGDKKVIIGGLDPSELSRMSVAQAIEKTQEILDKMPDMNGFILSTGDAVAYGTPIENLKAITDYLNEHGRFI